MPLVCGVLMGLLFFGWIYYMTGNNPVDISALTNAFHQN